MFPKTQKVILGFQGATPGGWKEWAGKTFFQPTKVKMTKERWNTMSAVHRLAKLEVAYGLDIYLHKKKEKWSKPTKVNKEIYRGKNLAGDCEDFAIYIRDLLVQHKFPRGSLRLMLCKLPLGVGYHVVLGVFTHKGCYIIDQNRFEPASIQDFEYYEWISVEAYPKWRKILKIVP